MELNGTRSEGPDAWLAAHFDLLVFAARSVFSDGRNADMADDAAQDAAVAIWRHWDDGFNPRLGTREAWAATIARRKAIDHRRALRGRQAVAMRAVARTEAEEASGLRTLDIEQLAVAREDVRHVWGQLTPDERRVVTLIAAGNTGPEIAERLSWPLGTLKTRIRWMRLRLNGARTRRSGVAPAV